MGLPHSAQCVLVASSGYCVVFRALGLELKVREAVGNRANVRDGEPEILRQVRQWQFAISSGRAVEE